MANPTIYDVASRAEVSIATVSRVLNNPHRVNEETRRRVLTAIDELKFVPKAEATARARRNNYRIGVLAPFFTYPSFVQRLRGVANVLNGSEYELVVYSVDSAHHYRSQLETLPIVRRIDGLIIMSLLVDDVAANRLLQHQLPTVLIESHHTALSGIEIDNKAGGRLAAQYLLERGHRNIGFIGIDSEIPGCTLPTSEIRLQGFQATMTDIGLPLHDVYIRNAENDMDAAYAQAKALLALPERPTAIFATSDLLALGVLKAIREIGLRIPDDIAVLGFDDLDIADYVGLSTVAQSLDESGRVGTELLLGRLAEPQRAVQHVRFPLQIIQRSTT
ncbi:MAG: LacI family DNA-binding transcriptional regulator [Caldilineaceae bacterium]|nr:LacI family DNA-binding transcriptional regulator [Caldilineaceae bacterium]